MSTMTPPAPTSSTGPTGPGPAAPAPDAPRAPVGDGVLSIALVLLMLAALVPLRGVFIGTEWVRPVAGAVVLAVGIGWGARQLGVGPLTHLVMTAASLLVFVTIAFLPSTAVAGVLPTDATLVALRDLFVRGLELVELRPSPTFAEAGLLLLAVAGAWVVTYLADGMLFVLRSPMKAIGCAIALWAVPLAVAPTGASIVLPAVTLLGASGILMLLGNALTSAAFGRAVTTGAEGRGRSLPPVAPMGLVLGSTAIVIALLGASVLPGFDAPPLYETRGGSGTTITTNPIVDIRSRLVASDTGPVLHVESPRPVYLRTTSLDLYDETEQWTAGTISGDRVQGAVDGPPAGPWDEVAVTVDVQPGIDAGAVLAPAPFQPIEVSGPKAGDLRYDARSATLTTPGDASLRDGDQYRVVAAIAQPDAAALRAVPAPGPGPSTALPANVPAEVSALARDIVAAAGATTMFDAALAVQDHLRQWDYSLLPEPGLGATAMLRFIDAQEGYCEQFAGTMAVMLRTLGIPARLAVGFTPGDLQADGTWRVTNANAHAWVEVDFGELGWITFEPTPRGDDNVLVTSAASVAPRQLLADSGAAAQPVDPTAPDPLAPTQPPAAPLPDEGTAPLDLDPAAGAAAADDGSGVPPLLVAVVLLALLGVGAGAWVRRDAGVVGPPPERIARARDRVQHVGRAAGRPRSDAETDYEYLARIAGGDPAGRTLAGPSTRAVYAPAVTEADADEAEAAADRLVHVLTGDLPPVRRAVVDLRARISALRTR
jgi:transglutaminase-like putative cysteine protease